MKKIFFTFINVIVFQLLFSSSAYADMTGTLVLNPPNPEPKSSVIVTLQSYSFDVNTALITWKIGDRTLLRGEGEKTITLKTGDVGESIQLNVVAETADGASLEQTVTITPSSIILLYEAPKSYVPLLYEGRSLPSDGGLVRVTALPQMSEKGLPVLPSSLAYSWYLNNSILKTMSGVGKQSANIRLDYLKSKNEIKVIVRSPYGTSSTKKITISPHPVMPLLYTHDPLFGTNFTSLIQKRFEARQDFTLSLEPFYVSQNDPKDPTFTWFLDRLPTTPLGGRVLALHPKENSYGTKLLNIKVAGPDKRLQKAETSVELIFDTRKQ